MKRLNSKVAVRGKKGDVKTEKKGNNKMEIRGAVSAAVLALFLLSIPDAVSASTVWEEGNKLFTDARTFIFGVTTAGAIVGLGVGAFFKFFSMGDHQRIQTGNKVMVGSLVGWGAVNGAFLLFNTISKYTPGGQVTMS